MTISISTAAVRMRLFSSEPARPLEIKNGHRAAAARPAKSRYSMNPLFESKKVTNLDIPATIPSASFLR